MPVQWEKVGNYTDIIYGKGRRDRPGDDNRPDVRNAFRPQTVMELLDAFARPRRSSIGAVLFTGRGGESLCSGGDQKVRGDGG